MSTPAKNKGRTPPRQLTAKRKHARSVISAVDKYCTAYEVIQWLQTNDIVGDDLNVHDLALDFASTSAVSADAILSVLDPA